MGNSILTNILKIIIGSYITIEGNEGAGKTLLMEMLVEWLKKLGIRFVTTCEPGGTLIGQQIREILISKKNSMMDALTELLLYIANRNQNIQEFVLPRIKEGYLVISDRGLDSSVVYQGAARKISAKIVRGLNNLVVGPNKPKLTIILLVKPEVGLTRVQNDQKRGGKDRIENEVMKFHRRVYNGYKNLAKTHKRFDLINTTKKTPEQVFKKVQRILIKRKIINLKGAI